MMGSNLRAVVALFAFVGLALAGTPARASLIGVELTPSYRIPDLASVYIGATWDTSPFTVGAGLETIGRLDGDVTQLNVDFDADSLVIRISNQLQSPTWNAATFNGVVFTAAVPLGLASATVDAGLTTMPGFDDSRVTFTGNEIRLNWQGLSSANGLVVAVDFTFGQVPEPGTLALLGMVVAGLGAARVRRRARR